MLAYLFWHRPREGADADRYQEAQLAFHGSLAHNPPAGMRGSAIYRIPSVPWAEHGQPKPSFEDWYLLDDFAAMGVLGEAAVGRGHRTAHDSAASAFGTGAGGLYGLLEGEATGDCLKRATVAVWVGRTPGSAKGEAAELLGDGMDPSFASVWRRQFVLGPAPEFCVLGGEAPAGVSQERLPAGWTARAIERELLFGG